jgi:hypothetical protein
MLSIKDTKKIEKIKSISAKNNFSVSSKLPELFRLFDLNRLCSRNNMLKLKGLKVSDILSILFLFPFLMIQSVNALFKSELKDSVEAEKDTFFRLKNNESHNWRNLLYLFAKKHKKLSSRSTSVETKSPKCLILDDSTIGKTGKKIEFIGKVFDHVIQRYVLGFKFLTMTFWDGHSLIPVDFSYHCEKGKNKKRPFGLKKRELERRFSKERRKGTPGYQRSNELFMDKITNGIAMLKRAVKHGFVPDYVLSDSWFSSAKFIKAVRCLKKGCIHFLGMVKMDKRHYEYQGQKLNAQALKKQLKSKTKRARKLNAYYIEVVVNYGDVGLVKLFFSRFSKRSKWRLIATTDIGLSFHQAVEIYNLRWSIEVMFKECKQHLNLTKCQSNDFDAHIADATISLILYLMLSFHQKISSYATFGELFHECRHELVEATVAEKLWQLFLSLQLYVAEFFEIDYYRVIEVVFRNEEIENIFKSLQKSFFEDDFSDALKKVA